MSRSPGQGVRWHPKRQRRRVVHLIAPADRRDMRVSRCGMPTNRAPLLVVARIEDGVTCRMCRRCAAADEGRNPGYSDDD